MKKILTILALFVIVSAEDVEKLAKKLSIYPGAKASVQWKRIFKSEKRLEKYKLGDLSMDERKVFEKYLVDHAADSEQPIVPGL